MTIGRNAPCPCGSGRKYKKCCLDKDAAAERAQALPAEKAEEDASRAEQDARTSQQEAVMQEGRQWQPKATSSPEPESAARSGEPDWPPLSPADQDLVDVWWKEVGPVYTGKGGKERFDWLLGRTLEFLDRQPRLFRYLDLHEEFLFELGGALARAGRAGDYFALLRRLRIEQPGLYRECFGYYDEDLIAEAIHTDRREDIPALLDLFKQDPVGSVDQLAKVVDLLAWRGFEEELHELLAIAAKPVWDSPEVIGGDFGLLWLTYQVMFPFFEVGNDSPDAIDRLGEAALAVGLLEGSVSENRHWMRRQLHLASRSPTEAGLDLKESKDESFYPDVATNFMGWVHRQKKLTWTTARYLGDRLLALWTWKGAKKAKRGSAFRLDTTQLDRYLAQACRDLICVYGVQAMSTLQAFHYFTEYLMAHGGLTAADASSLQSGCARLFETLRGAVDATDPAFSLCPTYDALIAGSLTPTRRSDAHDTP
jgi:hypothetical protein